MLVNELMDKLEGKHYCLNSYSILIVTGSDRERFLSGQTTNDNSKLEINAFILNSRLDRGGKLKAFFYHLKASDCDYLIVPDEISSSLKEDLEKYIIMEEVEIAESRDKGSILFTANMKPQEDYASDLSYFKGSFGFLPAYLSIGELSLDKNSELSDGEFDKLCLSRAVPVLGLTAKIDQLVTDTVVNLSGVSLSKGCFLGQETVSKIETRRGGAYLPVALEIEKNEKLKVGHKIQIGEKQAGHILETFESAEKPFIIASLLRNYRIDQKSFEIQVDTINLKAKVNYLPLGGAFEEESYLQYLYEKAVETFQKVGNEEAIESFKRVLKVAPGHEDSLESMGVIFGRMEKFEEGIELMDKVLESNSSSVMAHTNKSLFYMRLGKIEEAEEEKSQATLKSFASFGKIAEDKREAEKREEENKAEISRRLDMFKQVLEIDPDDELANYGMADILLLRGKANEAIPLLKKVLEVNSKYSVAYLLLGKCYIDQGMKKEAKDTFENGIGIASGLGDLMPANEMQNLLTKL